MTGILTLDQEQHPFLALDEFSPPPRRFRGSFWRDDDLPQLLENQYDRYQSPSPRRAWGVNKRLNAQLQKQELQLPCLTHAITDDVFHLNDFIPPKENKAQIDHIFESEDETAIVSSNKSTPKSDLKRKKYDSDYESLSLFDQNSPYITSSFDPLSTCYHSQNLLPVHSQLSQTVSEEDQIVDSVFQEVLSKKPQDLVDEIIQLVDEKPRGVFFKDRPEGNKRERKTEKQISVLIQAYKKNPKWSSKLVKRLAQETGLKTTQVYKWCWDQKNKS